MASKGKKPVADSFSSSQPGYISVAGETFFLNLPTDDTDTIGSKLVDDSLKGDASFQRLYLGDTPKEVNPKSPFTKQEQIDLRRIFRAVFGVSSLTSNKGLSIPCSKKDLDLLLKSLEIRRKVLIAQINVYDTLASPDVHARYMREHLIRLNKLIGDEIPNTLAPCTLTDVIDPNAPPRMPLDDARMLRLLEIFAYLLAQGKDPLSEFQKTLPSPNNILPRMAVKDAPGLKEYEDAYTKANPHKVPAYTDTLIKIKKILQGDVATGDAALDKQLQQAFESIEKAFGIAEPKGSFSDRADVVLKRLTQMEKEKKDDIAEIMKTKSALAAKQSEYDALVAKEKACQDELTKVKAEKTALEAELLKVKTDLAAANDKSAALDIELKAAKESITKLEEALAAANAAKAAADAALAAATEAKTAAEAALAAANEAKGAAEAALAAATATINKLQEDLKACEAAKAPLASRVEELTGQLAEKDIELAELQRTKAAIETRLNALLEVIPDLTPQRLRELLDAEGLVETLNEQIAELRRQLAACPPAAELERLTRLVDELQRRPTQEAYDDLQATVNRLQPLSDLILQIEGLLGDELTLEQIAELLRIRDSIPGLRTTISELERRPTQEAFNELQRQITELERRPTQEAYDNLQATVNRLQPLADLVAQLETLLGGALTPERMTELLRAEQSIAGLRARISELEGRPNITKDEYETLEGQLRDARARIEELQGRGDIEAEDLEELQENFETTRAELEDTVEQLEHAKRGLETTRGIVKGLQQQRGEIEVALKAANAQLVDCEKIKLELTAKKKQVSDLENKVASLEDKIKKASGNATTIQALMDQKALLDAALEKSKADLANADSEVIRLNKELSRVVGERDARPTQKTLDDMRAERNARPTQEEVDVIKGERNAAIAARDTAAGERNAAIAARDKAAGERNAAIAARDTAAGERNAAIAARDTAAGERNAAIAARDTAAGERNAAIAARDKAAGERNAAITEQKALQTRIGALEEQIRTQGVYKVVYTRIKEILGIRDGIEVPSEAQIDELLGTVKSRIAGAAKAEVNKAHVCLLNLVFNLLRRLTMKQGITTDSGLRFPPEKVQAMFGSVKGKSLTPIPDDILTVFMRTLKRLLEIGYPRAGEFEIYSDAERMDFAAIYSNLDNLLSNPLLFLNEDKSVASAFLNQFFTNEYDFTNLYLQSNGKLKDKDGREDLGLVNIASLFLLVLSFTQQILTTNQPVLEAAGCVIPSVDLKPVGPAAPVGPATEEDRCKPGIVPGTTFKRRKMPGPVEFDKLAARTAARQVEDTAILRELFTYLEQIKNSDPPVGPLCRASINRLPSEYDTHIKLTNIFGKQPVWHVALKPYKKEGAHIDPSTIKVPAGLPSRYGGTRKRKHTHVKKHTTKKMRRT